MSIVDAGHGPTGRTGKEPLVDVHAHFVTPWYAEVAAAAGHTRPDGMPGWPAWGAEDHLRLMDANGIDQAVLSISSPGEHFGDDDAAIELARRVNDFAAGVCADHPDRFRFFASVPLPAVDAALGEAARSLDDLGAAGIVVETNSGGMYLGDPALEPFLAELDRRGAVLFVHPTSPPGWEDTALGYPRPMLEFLVDSTRTVADLIMGGSLARHRSLRMIVSHCGGFLPLLVERLKLFASAFPSGPVGPEQIDESLRRLWYDLTGTPVPTHAETLIRYAGTEHLLYGSDYCWTPAAVVARQIPALDAGWPGEVHGDWRDLVADNAARLLAPAAPSTARNSPATPAATPAATEREPALGERPASAPASTDRPRRTRTAAPARSAGRR